MPASKVFPLQPELVDAVIAFANARIVRRSDLTNLFPAPWTPHPIPPTPQCIAQQQAVRRWLDDLSGPALRVRVKDGVPLVVPDEAANAMIGARWKSGERGVPLVGRLEFHGARDDKGKFREWIAWSWGLEHPTLSAVCGLAVVTIRQAGLRDKVGRCARAGCELYFVDRKSRGTRRKYCKTPECNAALNRKWVKESRSEE